MKEWTMNGYSAAFRTLWHAGMAALFLCAADAFTTGTVLLAAAETAVSEMAKSAASETEGAVPAGIPDHADELQGIQAMKDTGGIQAGDLIWFGTKQGSGQNVGEDVVSWRVLDPERMLLLSEEVLGKENGPVCFDKEAPYTNLWKDSDAKAWCDAFFENAFTAAQKEAILPTSGSDAACEAVSDAGKEIRFDAEENILDHDRIFFLSAQEVKSLLPEAGSRIGYYDGVPSAWWLRSPVENASGRTLRSPVAGIVTGQEPSAYEGARQQVLQALGIEAKPAGMGEIRGSVVDNALIDAGMRPAFHLDLSRILFASPVQGEAAGKTETSEWAEESGLWKVESHDVHAWRVAIADPALSVTFEKVRRDKDSLSIAYRDVCADGDAGEHLFISAAVLDRKGTLKAFGRLAQAKPGGGTVTVDLSGIFADAQDHLFLCLEAEYGACETLYAGGWTEIVPGT